MVQRDWLNDWSRSINLFGLNDAIGATTSHEGAIITSFPSWYGKAAWPFLTYFLTGRQPYSFPLFLSLFPFYLAFFSFLLGWNYSEFSSFFPRTKIFEDNSSLACLQILPLTDPTFQLFISHQMILLALAKTGGHFES